MRAEVELLLCCARTKIDDDGAERIKALLREEIDWPYLIGTAHAHHVMPLLYQNLHAMYPEAIPEAILNQLRSHFHANVQHNLLLTGELLKLLNLFEAHGIPAIPFKGPLLAASVYGNLSLRQFGDLDILVRKQDLVKARDLLLSQGYQTTTQLDDESKYYTFVRDDGRVGIDLQWQIAGKSFSFQPDTERLWERLEPISLAGTTVANLPPEDLFLILCVHGSKHLWQKLKWICDVAELIRVHRGLDWGRVMDQAGSMGNERMCTLGLVLANDLLGTTLLEGVLKRVQADPVVKSVAVQVREKLFAEAHRQSGDFARSVFYLRMRKGWRDRARYCLRYLHQYLCIALTPSAKDRALLPLPIFLSFLYSLLRPFRLVGKYGLRPWKWRHLLPQRFDIDGVQ